MTRVWKRNQLTPHVLFFDIAWPEEILKGIGKANFTKPGPAIFLTAEGGLSLLDLFPQSRLENAQLFLEKETGEQSELPTYAEAKKQNKLPRLPPTTWADCTSALTTYYLFLHMLFGDNNSHVRGIQLVYNQLVSMAEIRDMMDGVFFGHLLWAVIEDMAKNFNEPLVMTDFQDPRQTIVWP